MSQLISKYSLIPELHKFPADLFGSAEDLIASQGARLKDTLIIACSELGLAPDLISFGRPEQFVILQHLAASVPSKQDCKQCVELNFQPVIHLFEQHQFRDVIVCGHFGSTVIPYWLETSARGRSDVGQFRRRFDDGARTLVDQNYTPNSESERTILIILEHALCQIENLLSHDQIHQLAQSKTTVFHAWIVDNSTARIFSYRPKGSAFVLI